MSAEERGLSEKIKRAIRAHYGLPMDWEPDTDQEKADCFWKRSEEEMLKEQFAAIIEDNRKYPPKVIRARCNDCRNRFPKSAKCSVYPGGIPKGILLNKAECEEFAEIQR